MTVAHKNIIKLLVLGGFLALVVLPTATVSAANTSLFKPGRIIDNDIMTDYNSMTVSQIQKFLDGKIGNNCDTDGSEMYNSTYTRAEIGKMYNQPPPYICLNKYTQNGLTSAQIIYNVAQTYHINPKVLLVTLQKEQGLLTNEWPWPNLEYKSATGYGCPDNADCNAQYYGFTNQVTNTAKMYHAIVTNDPNWYTPYLTGNNHIYWDPSGGNYLNTSGNPPSAYPNSCGYSVVNIQNQATQALYNYTPYRPNPAALRAGYGNGDRCSAYGNRNFWLYYNDWFGSSINLFKPLQTPRWMRLTADTYKTNIVNGQQVDSVLPAGTEIYFDTKVDVGGVAYLRTKHDTAYHIDKGILLANLEEVPLDYTSLQSPRWLETKTDIRKIDPTTGQPVSGVIPAGTQIFFPTKLDIGNEVYLHTQHDTDDNVSHAAIPYSALQETDVSYVDLVRPRWMEASVDTSTKDIRHSAADVGSVIKKGTQKHFDHKIDVNGVWYLSDGTPTASDDFTGVPLSDLDNIKLEFHPLLIPRDMQMKSSSYKEYPVTETQDDLQLTKGQVISFTEKFTFQGKTYLRTEHDANLGDNRGVLLSDLMEVFEPMKTPRLMTPVDDSVYKQDATLSTPVGAPLQPGSSYMFTSKAEVGNIVYLRTDEDTTNNLNQGVQWNRLKNAN